MRPVIPSMIRGVFYYASHKVKVDNNVDPNACEQCNDKRFKAFRYAEKSNSKPSAQFEITFQLKNMSAKDNEKFSLMPMFFVIGCKGFCNKYWLVDDKTNTCRGIYQWDSVEDAEAYSKSFAVKFMKKRSVEGSIVYGVKRIVA